MQPLLTQYGIDQPFSTVVLENTKPLYYLEILDRQNNVIYNSDSIFASTFRGTCADLIDAWFVVREKTSYISYLNQEVDRFRVLGINGHIVTLKIKVKDAKK